MAVRDPQTEWLRVLYYRRMTPERRIEIAAQMFEDGDSILDRHPDISPAELKREIRRRMLGRRLAEVGAGERID